MGYGPRESLEAFGSRPTTVTVFHFRRFPIRPPLAETPSPSGAAVCILSVAATVTHAVSFKTFVGSLYPLKFVNPFASFLVYSWTKTIEALYL